MDRSSAAQDRWPDGSADECPKCGFLHAYDRSCEDRASSAASTVAALYVEKDGAYFGLPGVDPWDEERDARLYAGPWPVVAHPPCGRWSRLAGLVEHRWGHRAGEDGGCFDAALSCVFAFGGVLEHPAESIAWKRYGLPRPQRGYWQATLGGDFVTEVDQGAYGHRARKRTWLLYNGPAPPDLDWRVAESDVIVSGFLHRKGTDESRRVRPAEASRTPIAFRDVLLDMARSARIEMAA